MNKPHFKAFWKLFFFMSIISMFPITYVAYTVGMIHQKAIYLSKDQYAFEVVISNILKAAEKNDISKIKTIIGEFRGQSIEAVMLNNSSRNAQ